MNKASGKLSFPFCFIEQESKNEAQLEIMYSIPGFLPTFLLNILTSVSSKGCSSQ